MPTSPITGIHLCLNHLKLLYYTAALRHLSNTYPTHPDLPFIIGRIAELS